MSREQRLGVALLVGMAFGVGALLWLAIAFDRLPQGGVLIALGALAIAIAGQIPIYLAQTPRAENCARTSQNRRAESKANR